MRGSLNRRRKGLFETSYGGRKAASCESLRRSFLCCDPPRDGIQSLMKPLISALSVVSGSGDLRRDLLSPLSVALLVLWAPTARAPKALVRESMLRVGDVRVSWERGWNVELGWKRRISTALYTLTYPSKTCLSLNPNVFDTTNVVNVYTGRCHHLPPSPSIDIGVFLTFEATRPFSSCCLTPPGCLKLNISPS
jgi:hypothetical protein